MINLIKKIGGNWTFSIGMILAFIIIGVVEPVIFFKSLSAFWEIIRRILPVLVVVFLMMFLFNLWLGTKRVAKYLSRGSGVKGWLITIGFGLVSMGSLYIWYPMLADLQRKGMDNGLIAAFLYNQAIKIQLLPFLIYYFGWLFTIVVTVYMIFFSVISGLLIEKLVPSVEVKE